MNRSSANVPTTVCTPPSLYDCWSSRPITTCSYYTHQQQSADITETIASEQFVASFHYQWKQSCTWSGIGPENKLKQLIPPAAKSKGVDSTIFTTNAKGGLPVLLQSALPPASQIAHVRHPTFPSAINFDFCNATNAIPHSPFASLGDATAYGKFPSFYVDFKLLFASLPRIMHAPNDVNPLYTYIHALGAPPLLCHVISYGLNNSSIPMFDWVVLLIFHRILPHV